MASVEKGAPDGRSLRVAASLSTILIVDDDPSTRFVLRLILEREGYKVVEAGNGKAALDMIRPDPLPDIVMTDLMMPVMTGMELIRQLRSEPRTAAISIVVVSSNADAAQSLQSSGEVDAIVSKPFTASKLADRIRAVAVHPKRGQEPMERRA
jgi:two-component system, chemotaxis family, chemotaxis protein CheY